MLAQKDESSLVKAAFPIIPMISDYFFSDPEAMTVEEKVIGKEILNVAKADSIRRELPRFASGK